MLHHLSLGVRDLHAAGRFYDAVLAALGYRRVFEDDTAIGYGLVDDEDVRCLKLRDDASAPGPGFHLAFAAQSPAQVDAFHAALKAGDEAGALTLLAQDVMIFEGGGAERSREEYAAHHLGSDAAFSAATEASVTRRSGWASGDVAWIVTEGRTAGQFNGRAVNLVTTETMVLKRGPEGWRIQHIHWSSRTPR